MLRQYCLFCLILVLVGCQPKDISDSKPIPQGVTANESVPTLAKPTETPVPLPNFLGYTNPEPNSSYTQAEYQTLADLSSAGEFVGPGICFSMIPLWLMDKGDFPTLSQFLDRIEFQVDAKYVAEFRSLRKQDLLGIEGHDHKGELLWRTPDGTPFHVCYEADLGVGLHTATISVDRLSGDAESYTWSFEIRELVGQEGSINRVSRWSSSIE